MTKISKGARRHLLVLCTPGVSYALTLRNGVTGPARKAARALKKLGREVRSGDRFVVFERKGANMYEQMMADAHHDVTMALLGGVYP